MLDDNVVGEAIERPGGRRFVFIHPDRMAQVVKAHRERPLAVAAFLHGVAVHELTHIDGKMGDGHDEEFIARREDLGAATAHLLPAISVLVAKILRLPERESDDARRVARLERDLVKARGVIKELRGQLNERDSDGPLRTEGTRLTWSTLRQWLRSAADLVVSDMAPNTSGDRFTDHCRQIALADRALELALLLLRPGGGFVAKVFDGEDAPAYTARVKARFADVKRIKPDATRDRSVEFFLAGTGFRGA